MLKNRWTAAIATILVVAAVSPLLFSTGNDYLIQSAARVLVLSLLVLSVELAWGQTGIFTLGHALFFGVGAYTCGLLATKHGVTDIVTLVAAAVGVGVVAGLVVGLFLFTGRRVSPLYVGLFTLALAYVAQRLASSWAEIGAANGIPGIPLPTAFGSTITTGPPMFVMALVAAGIALLLVMALTTSQLGMVMNAVRDDEERTEFLGYRRARVQVAVFALSGGIAAAGGALIAVTDGFVSPTQLGVGLSTMAVLWVVLGGRGTVFGPLLALAILQALDREMQDAVPQWWPLINGGLLLATILFLPSGLMSAGQLFTRRSGRRRAPAPVLEEAA